MTQRMTGFRPSVQSETGAWLLAVRLQIEDTLGTLRHMMAEFRSAIEKCRDRSVFTARR